MALKNTYNPPGFVNPTTESHRRLHLSRCYMVYNFQKFSLRGKNLEITIEFLQCFRAVYKITKKFSEFSNISHANKGRLDDSALKSTPFWGHMSSLEKVALTFLVTKTPFHSPSQGLGSVKCSNRYAKSVLETMGKIHGILQNNDYEKSVRRSLIYGLCFKNTL